MSNGVAARSKTRRFLLQAMYQAELTREEYGSVAETFIVDHDMKRADLNYFREVLEGIHSNIEQLSILIELKLERAFAELDPIEKSILLLGAYELKSRLEVPYKVVINEGVELAKAFGATESFRLINSVLDELSKELRRLER